MALSLLIISFLLVVTLFLSILVRAKNVAVSPRVDGLEDLEQMRTLASHGPKYVPSRKVTGNGERWERLPHTS